MEKKIEVKISDDPAILIVCIYSLSDNKDASYPPGTGRIPFT